MRDAHRRIRLGMKCSSSSNGGCGIVTGWHRRHLKPIASRNGGLVTARRTLKIGGAMWHSGRTGWTTRLQTLVYRHPGNVHGWWWWRWRSKSSTVHTHTHTHTIKSSTLTTRSEAKLRASYTQFKPRNFMPMSNSDYHLYSRFFPKPLEDGMFYFMKWSRYVLLNLSRMPSSPYSNSPRYYTAYCIYACVCCIKFRARSLRCTRSPRCAKIFMQHRHCTRSNCVKFYETHASQAKSLH